MNLAKMGFQLPKKISFDDETKTPTYAKLIVEPLERGFGTTIGNSLRRVLLSSIEGSAVTAVRIPGVLHEFSSVKGVKEDVVDIILNVKKLRFKNVDTDSKILRINVKGHKVVTGADIQTPDAVEVINKDQHIATVDAGATFEMELYVGKGKGYVSTEITKEDKGSVDILPVDSVFSPIKKVNFTVEKARVGRSTDYDRLILEVWTDGSISPKKAISDAATIMMDHLDFFIFDEDTETAGEQLGPIEADTSNPDINENLLKSIDELELSVRAYNCLKNADVNNVAELVQKTEHEMLKTKNFGRKSLNEIKELLETMGLQLGMKIDMNELKRYAASHQKGGIKNAS